LKLGAQLNRDVTTGTGAVAVVVMGVSGAGKTTVGKRLADALNAAFFDGDDLFSDEARAMMAAGIALDDAQRWPWLDLVGGTIAAGRANGRGTVVACSALRRAYRDRLRAAVGSSLRLVYLRAEREAMRERVASRRGHYMPASLVESQFATLEPPIGEDDVIQIAADADLSTALPALAARLISLSLGERDA
jgi:gluconokinase